MILLVVMTFNASVRITSKAWFVMSAMTTLMAISLTVYLVNVMKMDLLALIVEKSTCAIWKVEVAISTSITFKSSKIRKTSTVSKYVTLLA